jgi:hypothetical protein
VALGDLTKQLAQQAIGGSMKDVLDSLRPPDLSRVSETLRTTKPTGPSQAEEVCAAILGQVQAMQKALHEDDELVVLLHAGSETVRVLEFFVPQWNVVVLSGIDTERNVTRVVSHIESVQLVCKVMKVQPPAKPARIGFVLPKPKP